MKKLLLFALLLLACFFVQDVTYAQGYTRNNVVKINPLSLGLLTLNASYERVINFNTSLQLGVYYTNVTIFGTSWEGVGITPEARVYLGKSKPRAKLTPEGFYVAPFARLQLLAITSELVEPGSEAKASLSNVSGGVVGGYQLLWGKYDRYTLDLFIGPSLENAKIVYEGGAQEAYFGGLSNFSGLSLRSGLTLGVAF
jgi:hypothetical protein